MKQKVIIILLICALCLAGCSKDFFSSGDVADEPGEDPVDESENQGDPWDNPESYPEVLIASPDPGDFSSDSTVKVKGRVNGPEPETVEINGVQVGLGSGGSFDSNVKCDAIGPLLPISVAAKSGNVRGAERVMVLLGEGLDEEKAIPTALAMNVTEEFLDKIGDLLAGLVMAFPFDQVLDSVNPIIDQDNLTLEISWITLGDMTIALDAVDEGLQIDAVISDLSVGLHVVVTVLGIPITIDGSADVSEVQFSSLAVATEDEQGNPQIVMQNVSTELIGFDLHVDNVPEWAIVLIDVAVREFVEYVVDQLFSNLVPDLVNGILGILQIKTDIAGLHVEAGLDSVVLNQAGVAVGFESNLTTLTTDPEAPVQDESLYTQSDMPRFTQTVPEKDEPYQLAVAISDDILNRAFYSVTKSGLLEFDLDSPIKLPGDLQLHLLAGSFAEIFPSLGNVDSQLPLRIHLSPAAPPVVTTRASGDRQFMFALGGFTLTFFIDTEDATIGEWEAFSVAVDFAAEVGINIDSAGAISLDLALPTLDRQVVHNQIGEEQALLLKWILEIAEPIVGDVLPMLSDFSVTIPHILGFQIVPVDVQTGGPENDFLMIYLRMEN